ncbi:MAG TPA: hypothetical protein VND19_10915 [Acetobacteraceae bacterium]|nr:hypothetical protein [Acetobacteraceae bacterium]
MAADQLFVLVTEIGGSRREYAIFRDEGDAGAAYFEGNEACMDGLLPENMGDPAAVTDCWLYKIDTASEDEARKAAVNGTATLVAKLEPPDDF